MEKKLLIKNAYQACAKIAKGHYENFPVASIFLPRALQKSITVFYTFAREADDIVDEGTGTPAERLKALETYWQQLEETLQGNPPNKAVFIALQDTLLQHPTLPTALLFDLLRAFKQDITTQHYQDFSDVHAYCQLSANPIGRLLLHLTNHATEQNCQESDAICTALQLLNFIQDLHSDIRLRNRCYLPQNEMQQFSVTIEMLASKQENMDLNRLITLQLDRAKTLLRSGFPLGKRLKQLFGLEIRLITNAGWLIANQLSKRNSIYQRPVLKKWQMPLLLLKSLL
jgi:squalene synthase HpnC